MKNTDKVTSTIILFLNTSGHVAWRHNQVKVPGRNFPKSNLGIADVEACCKPYGKHLEVEVKTPPDKPSTFQLERAAKVRATGGWYIFVKSFDDFMEQFSILRSGGL